MLCPVDVILEEDRVERDRAGIQDELAQEMLDFGLLRGVIRRFQLAAGIDLSGCIIDTDYIGFVIICRSDSHNGYDSDTDDDDTGLHEPVCIPAVLVHIHEDVAKGLHRAFLQRVCPFPGRWRRMMW